MTHALQEIRSEFDSAGEGVRAGPQTVQELAAPALFTSAMVAAVGTASSAMAPVSTPARRSASRTRAARFVAADRAQQTNRNAESRQSERRVAPLPPGWGSIISTKDVVPQGESSYALTSVSYMIAPEHSTPLPATQRRLPGVIPPAQRFVPHCPRILLGTVISGPTRCQRFRKAAGRCMAFGGRQPGRSRTAVRPPARYSRSSRARGY